MTKDSPDPSSAQGDSRAAIIRAAYADAMRWGLCPVPSRRLTKAVALNKWKHLQERRPTPNELEQWIRQYGEDNLGSITGAVAGVFVIDFDTADALAQAMERGMPRTPRVRTFKGAHLYFRHPGFRIPTKGTILPGVDVRGDGGFIVLPPSMHCIIPKSDSDQPAHESGHVYTWEVTPDEAPFADAPEWILEALRPKHTPDIDTGDDNTQPIMHATASTQDVTAHHRTRMERAARAAMDDEEARVRATPEGNRDNVIYSAACNMGEFIAGGWIDAGEVRRRLTDAGLSTGQPKKEVSKAIRGGFEKVSKNPRTHLRERPGHAAPSRPPDYTDADAPPPHTGPRDAAAPDAPIVTTPEPTMDPTAKIITFDPPTMGTDRNPETRMLPPSTTWRDAQDVLADISWAWDNWLPNGLVTMIAAESGMGKSYLALRIAAVFASGMPWPDGSPYKGDIGKVLWAEAEGVLSINVDRWKRMGQSMESMVNPLPDPLEQFSLDNALHVDLLRREAGRSDVRIIVLDSLSAATRHDEDRSGMQHVVKILTSIAAETGKPVLVLHHFNKGSQDEGGRVHARRVRGSSAIVQPVRAGWALDSPNEEDPTHKRLSMFKTTIGMMPDPMGFRISTHGVTFTGDAPKYIRRPDPERETAVDRAARLLRTWLADGPMLSAELEARMKEEDIPTATYKRARELAGVRSEKRRGDSNAWYSSLPVAEDDRAPSHADQPDIF